MPVKPLVRPTADDEDDANSDDRAEASTAQAMLGEKGSSAEPSQRGQRGWPTR